MKFLKRNDKLFLLIGSSVLIVFSIIFLWNKVDSQYDLILNSICIGLGINIFSSIVLIYLIDERQKNKELKEKLEKRGLFYNKLIRNINTFNKFIANMYKATMKEKVAQGNKIIKNIYYDVDKLYEQICKLDLKKNGYEVFMNEEKPIELTWYIMLIYKLKDFYSSIQSVTDTYLILIDSELLKHLEKIITFKEKVALLDNPVGRGILNREWVGIVNNDEIRNSIYNILELKKIFKEISDIMEIINNTDEENFNIDIDIFNNDKQKPLIGSGLEN